MMARDVSAPWRWGVLALLCALALYANLRGLAAIVAPSHWWQALHAAPQPAGAVDLDALIFRQMALPRMAISWIVGAALGLAGVLFQQCLRNPLADPATLGVSSGAYLALAASALFAPALLDFSPVAVALGGGALAAALVLLASWRAHFSTIAVILAGLIVSLFCGAAGAALTLLNHEYLNSLFIWQTGSLVQNGWDQVGYLVPRVLVLGAAALAMLRPLSMLALDDARVAALGVHVARTRLAVLALGVALSALCVSVVGVIGFIGLMAPNLARLLGARTLGGRMALATLLGAVLLWLTDQVVQLITWFPNPVPAGSACALVGAPLMLWLLLRQRGGFGGHVAVADAVAAAAPRRTRAMLAGCAAILLVSLLAGLGLGRGAHGWEAYPHTAWSTIVDWRLARVVAAGLAGALLAMAGALLQRITGNPMASPEVLGISSGASLGVIAALFAIADLGADGMLGAAFLGAFLTLLLVLALNWRSGFAPERLLLAGVALSTMLTAVAACLLTSGDPRTAMLLTWMSGSTYRATLGGSAPAALVLLLVAAAALPGVRLLHILPLGEAAARALGVPVTLARCGYLLLIALATAAATLLVGPLSFVGLLASHFVASLGLQRPRAQLAGALLVGASLMIWADWVGRNILFPWQVPAGLVAVLLGAPAFLWFLWRRT